MLIGVVINDAELFNEKPKKLEDFYNYNRPHAALDGKTLYEGLREEVKLSGKTMKFSPTKSRHNLLTGTIEFIKLKSFFS